MNAIQLEFNIDNDTEEDVKLNYMQQQINDLADSMGKVRRKIFSEVTELKNICMLQKVEIEELKTKIREITNEKAEWRYKEDGSLFDVPKYKQACG